MDRIFIKGLRCTAHIGCKPEERRLPQAIIVDAAIECDFAAAAAHDDLALTVNYAHLSKAIISACEESQCQLIETLAVNLAGLCLDSSPIVSGATVRVVKPAGLPNGEYAAVETTRKR